jgi:hypothetical protein
MTPFYLVNTQKRFGATFYLNLQDRFTLLSWYVPNTLQVATKGLFWTKVRFHCNVEVNCTHVIFGLSEDYAL